MITETAIFLTAIFALFVGLRTQQTGRDQIDPRLEIIGARITASAVLAMAALILWRLT